MRRQSSSTTNSRPNSKHQGATTCPRARPTTTQTVKWWLDHTQSTVFRMLKSGAVATKTVICRVLHSRNPRWTTTKRIGCRHRTFLGSKITIQMGNLLMLSQSFKVVIMPQVRCLRPLTRHSLICLQRSKTLGRWNLHSNHTVNSRTMLSGRQRCSKSQIKI